MQQWLRYFVGIRIGSLYRGRVMCGHWQCVLISPLHARVEFKYLNSYVQKNKIFFFGHLYLTTLLDKILPLPFYFISLIWISRVQRVYFVSCSLLYHCSSFLQTAVAYYTLYSIYTMYAYLLASESR